jgi:hypothetical protein
MMQKLLLSCLLVALVYCSSHSEAPGTAKMPQSDITDVYAFRCYEPGREDHTCLIFNANALQAPGGGPNYFTLSDDHFYELYIDNDGDAKEDITFSFYFGSSLGGELEDVLYHADEDDCVLNQNPRSVQPDPVFVKKHGGLTVPVNGRDVPVALKTLGSITANDQRSLNWHEWYKIRYITGDRTYGDIRSVVRTDGNDTFVKPFDYAGTKTFPDYESYADQYIYSIDIPDCSRAGRVFVGQRAESFAIPIGEVFDLVNFIPIPDFPGAIEQSKAHNTIAGFNLDSFALEIPTECLVREDQDGVIGVWTAVRRLHHDKDAHVPGKQTSRLGNPLVNELLVGLRDKGKFSNGEPQFDQGFVDEYINYPSFPEILNILFKDAVNGQLQANFETLAPTNFPREDLYAIFMTGLDGINQPPDVVPAEMMRLNTTTPVTPRNSQNSFGVIGLDGAGYPNGRRPGDDVVDITLRCAMGRLCELGLYCAPEDANIGHVDLTDGAPTSATDFLNEFPYLNYPNPGSVGL